MSAIGWTSTKGHTYGGESFVVTWTGVTGADTAVPVEVPAAAKISVQFGGTFDGATVVVSGSIDGTNYITLTDLQGNTLSKTSAAIEGIQEQPRWIKFTHSGGGGSQALRVDLYLGRR